jgi:hypothetical protein
MRKLCDASTAGICADPITDFTRDNGVLEHIIRHSIDVVYSVDVSLNCDCDTMTSNCKG